MVKFNSEALPAVLGILWDILLDLDDLSASTSSVMSLLGMTTTLMLSTNVANNVHNFFFIAEFYAFSSIPAPNIALQSRQGSVLASLVPRLWAFMRHNIFSVRLAALNTLRRLLEPGETDTRSWLPHVLRDALKHVYNNIVVEEKQEIRQASLDVRRTPSPRSHSLAHQPQGVDVADIKS